MKWNKWPYWVRGGVVSVLVFLILLFVIGSLSSDPNSYLSTFDVLIILPPIFLLSFLPLQWMPQIIIDIFPYLFWGCLLFILGGIIGSSYGKLNKDNQRSNRIEADGWGKPNS
jgi:hypothetical protein